MGKMNEEIYFLIQAHDVTAALYIASKLTLVLYNTDKLKLHL